MKPYRGMHLAAAVLFAALPLWGCGDADKYAESGAITLTSDVSTVEVKKSVVFTVVGVPTAATTTAAHAKVIKDECDMSIQYKSQGGGVTHDWSEISGTAPTRIFSLTPREVTPLTVMARGKCIGSNEQWEYSSSVLVTVTDKTLPEVTDITLEANPTSVAKNKPVTFTLDATTKNGATASDKCTLNLTYQYSGAGFGVTTVNPAYLGQFILTPTEVGDLTVTATGWCSENTASWKKTTAKVSVTAVTLPTVTSVKLTPASNPYTIAPSGLNITLSATVSSGCTAKFSYTYSGGGISGSVASATAGIINLTPNSTALSPLLVDAAAWCEENPSEIVNAIQLSVVIK